LEYNLLFRWFVGMEMDEPVWNHAVFSKNRERLLNQNVAQAFFRRVLAKAKPHLSDEHFTVDGTMIEAWASQKSFQKKDGGEGDGSQFRGERRTNDTHESKTDSEAKLYRKGHGQEAKLGYLGHVLMENRNELIVGGMVHKRMEWQSATRRCCCCIVGGRETGVGGRGIASGEVPVVAGAQVDTAGSFEGDGAVSVDLEFIEPLLARGFTEERQHRLVNRETPNTLVSHTVRISSSDTLLGRVILAYS
jgi:hypothetical protein